MRLIGSIISNIPPWICPCCIKLFISTCLMWILRFSIPEVGHIGMPLFGFVKTAIENVLMFNLSCETGPWAFGLIKNSLSKSKQEIQWTAAQTNAQPSYAGTKKVMEIFFSFCSYRRLYTVQWCCKLYKYSMNNCTLNESALLFSSCRKNINSDIYLL